MKITALILFVSFWSAIDPSTVIASGDKVGTLNGSIFLGGNAISAEPTRDLYNIGLSFQGQVGYTLSANLTLLPVVLTYAKFSGIEVTPGISADDLTSFSFSPSFKLSVDNERNINPFLIVGIGLYRTSDRTVKKKKFGFNAGIGSEFAINDQASLSAQARFHNVFSDDFTFVDFNLGVNFYIGTE